MLSTEASRAGPRGSQAATATTPSRNSIEMSIGASRARSRKQTAVATATIPAAAAYSPNLDRIALPAMPEKLPGRRLKIPSRLPPGRCREAGPVPTLSAMTTPPPKEPGSLGARVRRLLAGKPRDLHDRSVFHRLSLVAFLAWVGLGADGLSSSAYGPEEAFRQLGEHTWLAVALAALMAATVLLISTAYRRIIEEFPTGGGGYVVATKLLGER